MKSNTENLILWTKRLKKMMKGNSKKDLDKDYVLIIQKSLLFNVRPTIVKTIEKQD